LIFNSHVLIQPSLSHHVVSTDPGDELRAQFLTRGRYLLLVGTYQPSQSVKIPSLPPKTPHLYLLTLHSVILWTPTIASIRPKYKAPTLWIAWGAWVTTRCQDLICYRSVADAGRPAPDCKTPFFEKVVNSICTSQLVTYYLYPIYLLFFSPRDKSQRPQFLGLVKP
jgi:hypothetical protein